jgi:hypothetical protein
MALQCNYLECEKLKKRIDDLKSDLSDQKKKGLTYQHSSEMVNLEENYNKEILEINLRWETVFNEFNEKVKKEDENLNVKHHSEMENLINHLEEKLPKQIKFSKEFLDLKQCELNLVKQERLTFFTLDI